jgi:hypothetical protein
VPVFPVGIAQTEAPGSTVNNVVSNLRQRQKFVLIYGLEEGYNMWNHLCT